MDALSDKAVIHDALIKTIATKRFVGLDPKLKEFMMHYENAIVNSRHFDKLLLKLMKQPNYFNIKVFEFKKSISTNIKIEWEALSIAQQKLLIQQYGITQKQISELSLPLQNRMAALLSSSQMKTEKQISELEKLVELNQNNEEFAEKKKQVKEKLQSLVIFMKSDDAKLYRRDHEDEIYALVQRAEELEIEIDIRGS